MIGGEESKHPLANPESASFHETMPENDNGTNNRKHGSDGRVSGRTRPKLRQSNGVLMGFGRITRYPPTYIFLPLR